MKNNLNEKNDHSRFLLKKEPQGNHRYNKLAIFYLRIKTYFENTSWQILEKTLKIGVSFFVAIIVARYLGPEKFGVLAYVISLVSLFSIAGHAGLIGLVVRELVKHPESKAEIMGTSFILKGLGYLIGIILLIAFVFATEKTKSSEFYMVIILSITLLLKPFDIIDFWFQSRLEAKYAAKSNILALFASSIFQTVLVFLSAHLILFSLANLLQTVIITIALIYFYKKKSNLNPKDWSFSLNRAKSLFSEAWMVFLGSIFAIIYLKIDQIMLKWLVDAEEVGIYAVASTLSEAWYFVPVAIVNSVFPKLIQLRNSSPDIYKKRLQQLFDLLFIVALGVASIITLNAEPFIITMFSEAYIQSSSILIIHIWAALFIFMRTVFSKWILIESALKFSLITQGLGALANVLLNYYLIPTYGGVGAAYATLLSYAMASYIALAIYPKTRPIFFMMTKAIFSPLRYTILKFIHSRT